MRTRYTLERLKIILQEDFLLNQPLIAKINAHAQKDLLIEKIFELHRIMPLTSSLLDALLESEHVAEMANAIDYLHHAGLLPNLHTLKNHANKLEFCYALHGLATLNFHVTEEQLDHINLYAHILGLHQGVLFSMIPPHWLDIQKLNIIFQICQTYFDNTQTAFAIIHSYIVREILHINVQQLMAQGLQFEAIIPILAQHLMAQGIALNFMFFDNAMQPDQQEFNDSQSTHTASVHQSVSESAIKLKNLYAGHLVNPGKDVLLNEIREYVSTLPSDKTTLVNENAAAKRLIDTLHMKYWEFIDPKSQVSLLDILLLAWVAIHDDKKRIGTLTDAKTRFVRGLYEIKRGDNLDADGENDNGEDDKTICTGGAFNKILESLESIHPDVEIRRITKQGATHKLQHTTAVTEFIVEDLKNSHLSADEMVALYKECKSGGADSTMVQASWNKVKPKVAEYMQEYRGAFSSQKEFDDFIDVTAPLVINTDTVMEEVKQILPAIQLLSQLDEEYRKYKEETNDKEINEWPRLYGFFNWKNTLAWQWKAKEQRSTAFETLKNEIRNINDDKIKKMVVKHALSLRLFSEHRSNYFYWEGSNTDTVNKIYEIKDTIKKHKKSESMDDKFDIYKQPTAR